MEERIESTLLTQEVEKILERCGVLEYLNKLMDSQCVKNAEYDFLEAFRSQAEKMWRDYKKRYTDSDIFGRSAREEFMRIALSEAIRKCNTESMQQEMLKQVFVETLTPQFAVQIWEKMIGQMQDKFVTLRVIEKISRMKF